VLTHLVYRLALRRLSPRVHAQAYIPESPEQSTITAVLTQMDELVKIVGVFVEILFPGIVPPSAFH
jgi:hypothetical protein